MMIITIRKGVALIMLVLFALYLYTAIMMSISINEQSEGRSVYLLIELKASFSNNLHMEAQANTP